MDHYATLGVSRTSEDVVIRAAYLALMRRYHPDTNPSSTAAGRVRDITTAYEVLSDKNKRAAYDRPNFESVGGAMAGRAKRPPVGPIFFAATMLLLCVAVLVVWLRPFRSVPAIGQPMAEAGERGARMTGASCAWPDATEAITQELFRQARMMRGANAEALALIAPQMVVRISPTPTPRSSPGTGKLTCKAAVEFVVPVSVAVPDGRRSFEGEIAYSLDQPTAERPQHAIFGRADRLAALLASLPRPLPASVNRGADQNVDQTVDLAEPPPPEVVTRPAPIEVRPTIQATPAATPRPGEGAATERDSTPRAARTPGTSRSGEARSGEAAIGSRSPASTETACLTRQPRWAELLCQNKALGALDRQLGALDAQSWSNASAFKRDLLRQSRNQFSANRNQCASETCVRQLTLGRMKMVAEIMRSDRPASARR